MLYYTWIILWKSYEVFAALFRLLVPKFRLSQYFRAQNWKSLFNSRHKNWKKKITINTEKRISLKFSQSYLWHNTSQCKHYLVVRGTAIAQWIRPHLLSCNLGFESQHTPSIPYHLESILCFTYCHVKRTKINGLGPFKKNHYLAS